MHFLGFWFVYRQARIHTGFHRFTEIGQIFHKKHVFNNNSRTFQVEIRKMVYRYKCFPGVRPKPGKGNFCMPPGFPRSLLPRPLLRKSVSIYPRSASDRDYSVSLTGHLYKTDIMVKRTPTVGPHLSFLPLFDRHLYKTDIALRRTLSTGPKVVRLRESWL